MMTFEICIDRERCMGTGVCVMAAPLVFDQNEEDGKVILIGDSQHEAQISSIKEAVSSCPTKALSLRYKSGDEASRQA